MEIGNRYLYVLNYVKRQKWPHAEAGKAKLVVFAT